MRSAFIGCRIVDVTIEAQQIYFSISMYWFTSALTIRTREKQQETM